MNLPLNTNLTGKVAVITGAAGTLCSVFSKALAASGAILGDVWTDGKMPVVDSLGEEFLEYVKTGMQVTVGEEGLVTVE